MAVRSAVPLLRVILWAQWRSVANLRVSEGAWGRWLAALAALLWYGLWTAMALGAAVLLAEPSRQQLALVVPWGLLSVFLYWQLAPLITASLGAALDLRRLAVYPVPENALFQAEVLLRLVTTPEMSLVLAGSVLGLLRNPAVPRWSPLLALPLFALFNLLLSAGLRGLLEGLFARRGVRELAAFVLVLAAATPQLLLLAGPPGFLREVALRAPPVYWPWVCFGRLSIGWFGPQDWALAGVWMAAAYIFGRTQFQRVLRAGQAWAATGADRRPRELSRDRQQVGLLSCWLGDPLGVMVEKELRSLARSPRFRLVFLMGFSFGFLIWLPLVRHRGLFWENYPILVATYAVLLLADILFWNAFGMDRAAVQFWFIAPVPLRRVIQAKNIAGAMLAFVEVSFVLGICALLGVRTGWAKVAETYAVTLSLSLYLLAAGNLSSVWLPRPVDPEQSWARASAGRFQLLVLVVYPLLGAPIGLAYWFRYALASQTAFLIQLALAALLGVLLYRLWLGKAVELAHQRKEAILRAMTESGGPVLMR